MQQPPKKLARLKGLIPPNVKVGEPRVRDMGGADAIYKKAMLGDPSDYGTGQAQAWMERFGGPGGEPEELDIERVAREMPDRSRAFRAWEDTLNTILPRGKDFPSRVRVASRNFEGGGRRMTGGPVLGATSAWGDRIEVNGDYHWDDTLGHEQYHARDPSKDPFDLALHRAVDSMYSDPAVRRKLQRRTPVGIGNPEEYRAALFGFGSRALGQLTKEDDPLAYMQNMERARPLQGRAMLAIASKSPYHAKAAEILRKMGFTPPEEK